MKHILTGPSSALAGDDFHVSNSCNAVLHRMMAVEAENVAYSAVQVSYSLEGNILIHSFSIGTLCNYLS